MFIGRKHELEKLSDLYVSNKFQFAVIYGRRRIGKTTLINEFVKDKPAIYFTGAEENEKDNLARFNRAIHQFTEPESEAVPAFSDFETSLKKIAELAKEERLVLIIDEFPFLAGSCPAISSILQLYIDHHYLQSKLFLILCGSSMSFMERQVLGYQSPLYGRRTTQMKLKPFDFWETQAFFPNMSKTDVFAVHAITGGIPQYLSFISEEKSLEENISSTFLSTDAPLFEEPANLLKQELRDPANYNSIIQGIASGCSKQNEIATKTGIQNTSITKYLSNLTDLGIVEKFTPVTEASHPKTRRTLYRISDGMFRFWYTFVSRNIDAIERGYGGSVWPIIEERLPDFLGHSFEELAIDYLWKNYMDADIVPFHFNHLGSWWGTDHIERKAAEIDIMGVDHQEKSALFGECKWQKEKADRAVLETLLYRGSLFQYPKKHFYLFSRSGFTSACIKLAKEADCRLITFDEM